MTKLFSACWFWFWCWVWYFALSLRYAHVGRNPIVTSIWESTLTIFKRDQKIQTQGCFLSIVSGLSQSRRARWTNVFSYGNYIIKTKFWDLTLIQPDCWNSILLCVDKNFRSLSSFPCLDSIPQWVRNNENEIFCAFWLVDATCDYNHLDCCKS